MVYLLIFYLFACVYVCVSVCLAHAFRCLRRLEGLRYPGIGVAGDCALPDVGARNQISTHFGQLTISARAASVFFFFGGGMGG